MNNVLWADGRGEMRWRADTGGGCNNNDYCETMENFQF